MTNEEKKILKNDILIHVVQATIYIGNLLTSLGCLTLLLGVLGAFDMNLFAIGLSSGVRIIGTVAIAGCLLSAIGYGVFDHLKN
jgi:hypothetical protein